MFRDDPDHYIDLKYYYVRRFVEIEGPGESAVMAVRNSLGLEERPVIKSSYVSLLIDYLRTHDLPTNEASFDR